MGETANPIDDIIAQCAAAFRRLEGLDEPELVEALNAIRAKLAEYSPFRSEPVDCVQWIPADAIQANTYNPNRVAPPEMKLLELSILSDGYTQPIVAYPEDGGGFTVVDGFHRNRVGKESKAVRERVRGYLPIVAVRGERGDIENRMAATIRHNRARGRHQVDAMTEIVLELSRRNWSDAKIAKELGMDPDEVLRFKQIGGLADLFANEEFSEAWEIDDEAARVV